MVTVDPEALRARMKTESTEALVRTCTLEAGDYTEEALAMAREELAARGEDVSKLVPAPRSEAREDPRKLGAMLVVAGLVVALFTAPWIDVMPWWLVIAVESAASSLALLGALRMSGPRRET